MIFDNLSHSRSFKVMIEKKEGVNTQCINQRLRHNVGQRLEAFIRRNISKRRAVSLRQLSYSCDIDRCSAETVQSVDAFSEYEIR